MTFSERPSPEDADPQFDSRRQSDVPAQTRAHAEALDKVSDDTRHVTDSFVLPDETLRDAESGRWHAGHIAEALGVSLTEFAGMIDVNVSTIRESPDDVPHQERLVPFANIIAMLRDYFSGDDERVRAWLNRPQSRLGNQSPLDALRTRGTATVVEQWIAALWLGEGD